MSFAPGTSIGTNLRLVRLLAKGGMGSVWIAEHLALQTHVAVKFLSEGSLSETAAGRFEQEAAAMARLKSPHVVQVFDFGLAPGGIPYISMDLLEGESLGSRLRKRGRLSTVETAAIVMQTCRALSLAHELDVVHRDIKPDNIFLTDSGGELFVKVLDFGIAKTGASSLGMTHSGMTIGTPFYMSPEQILSARTVTRSADLWALAAMSYECLTGQVPFHAESYGGLCLAISAGRFEPPSRVQPDLPPSLDIWFTRAFQPEESARFTNAVDVSRSFLAAAQVSRAEAMSVPSGLGQRRPSYPSSGRMLTVQVVEDDSTRPAVRGRESPPEGQVPTQRSVVAEEGEGLQISRPSLGGASLSTPPVDATASHTRRFRWRLAALAGVATTAILAVAILRQSAGRDAAMTTGAAADSARAVNDRHVALGVDPEPTRGRDGAPSVTNRAEGPPAPSEAEVLHAPAGAITSPPDAPLPKRSPRAASSTAPFAGASTAPFAGASTAASSAPRSAASTAASPLRKTDHGF